MSRVITGLVFSILLSAGGVAFAQYTDDSGGGGYYEQPSGGEGDQGGYYDPSYDPNSGYGSQPQPQPQTQPQPQPQPQPAVSAEVGVGGAEDEDGFKGFELGINWAGGSKVAFEPGVLLGRVGIYLLAGFDYHKEQETASTDDTELTSWDSPWAGAGHHAGPEDFDEEVTIESSLFTFDIGLAVRIYLLEQLRAHSPNLYLEIGLGWRGAKYKSEIDWAFTGDEDAFQNSGIGADYNNDGEIDEDDIDELEYERNKTWNQVAKDVANDQRQKNNGMWARVGVGGEYVFTGGFGIAGEVGLDLFWNTPWEEKAPYGYDDDSDVGDFDWEYEDVDYHGWSLDFGMYYSIALRYHF